MKLFRYKDRDHYLRTQIERSQRKSEYCKVYFADVIRYRHLLELNRTGFDTQQVTRNIQYRIFCLGVRGGAEVDLFRAAFFGPLLHLKIVQDYASHRDNSQNGEVKTQMARRLGIGSGSRKDGRVVGVEINPEVEREDIWTGSFDELPKQWGGRFNLIYSNSIDHSQDPVKTISEWKRVSAPGAFVILAFTESKTISDHDPFGGFDYKLLQKLWQAPIVYLTDTFNRNGYREICFLLGSDKNKPAP